jgi:hypothetical protein
MPSSKKSNFPAREHKDRGALEKCKSRIHIKRILRQSQQGRLPRLERNVAYELKTESQGRRVNVEYTGNARERRSVSKFDDRNDIDGKGIDESIGRVLSSTERFEPLSSVSEESSMGDDRFLSSLCVYDEQSSESKGSSMGDVPSTIHKVIPQKNETRHNKKGRSQRIHSAQNVQSPKRGNGVPKRADDSQPGDVHPPKTDGDSAARTDSSSRKEGKEVSSREKEVKNAVLQLTNKSKNNSGDPPWNLMDVSPSRNEDKKNIAVLSIRQLLIEQSERTKYPPRKDSMLPEKCTSSPKVDDDSSSLPGKKSIQQIIKELNDNSPKEANDPDIKIAPSPKRATPTPQTKIIPEKQTSSKSSSEKSKQKKIIFSGLFIGLFQRKKQPAKPEKDQTVELNHAPAKGGAYEYSFLIDASTSGETDNSVDHEKQRVAVGVLPSSLDELDTIVYAAHAGYAAHAVCNHETECASVSTQSVDITKRPGDAKPAFSSKDMSTCSSSSSQPGDLSALTGLTSTDTATIYCAVERFFGIQADW